MVRTLRTRSVRAVKAVSPIRLTSASIGFARRHPRGSSLTAAAVLGIAGSAAYVVARPSSAVTSGVPQPLRRGLIHLVRFTASVVEDIGELTAEVAEAIGDLVADSAYKGVRAADKALDALDDVQPPQPTPPMAGEELPDKPGQEAEARQLPEDELPSGPASDVTGPATIDGAESNEGKTASP